MKNKVYDHKGLHATADILLNSYPKNAIEIFQESLHYSNLNIVAKKVHHFTDEAATGVYVLAESSADIHEYPEVDKGYICVSVFTCGIEGDPVAAIEHFISQLDVKTSNVKCFNRGHFEKNTISMLEKSSRRTSSEEVKRVQKLIDSISKSLTADQLNDLDTVITWCEQEKLLGKRYPHL